MQEVSDGQSKAKVRGDVWAMTSVSLTPKDRFRMVRVLKRSHSANELSKCNKIQAWLQRSLSSMLGKPRGV